MAPLIRVIPETAVASAFLVGWILRVPHRATFGEKIDPNECTALTGLCAVFADYAEKYSHEKAQKN